MAGRRRRGRPNETLWPFAHCGHGLEGSSEEEMTGLRGVRARSAGKVFRAGRCEAVCALEDLWSRAGCKEAEYSVVRTEG